MTYPVYTQTPMCFASSMQAPFIGQQSEEWLSGLSDTANFNQQVCYYDPSIQGFPLPDLTLHSNDATCLEQALPVTALPSTTMLDSNPNYLYAQNTIGSLSQPDSILNSAAQIDDTALFTGNTYFSPNHTYLDLVQALQESETSSPDLSYSSTAASIAGDGCYSSYRGSEDSPITIPSDAESLCHGQLSRQPSQLSLKSQPSRQMQPLPAVLGRAGVTKPSSATTVQKKKERKAPSPKKGKSVLSQEKSASTDTPRFKCTFAFAGCEDTFGAKNEWKRHVSSQHLRFLVWVCDLIGCQNSSKGAFPRKDLYSEHLKRIHFDHGRIKVPRDELCEMISRAEVRPRKPPTYATCNICKEKFHGEKAWDARMEHVGGHYDRGQDPREDIVPSHLLEWMLSTGVIVKESPSRRIVGGADGATTGYVLAGDSKNTRTPARQKSASASPVASSSSSSINYVGRARPVGKRLTKRQLAAQAAVLEYALEYEAASDEDALGEVDE